MEPFGHNPFFNFIDPTFIAVPGDAKQDLQGYENEELSGLGQLAFEENMNETFIGEQTLLVHEDQTAHNT